MKDYKYDVCIVGGGGHVGLPLAIVFASKGLKTLIYDINERTLEKVRNGIVPFAESGAEPMLKRVLADGKLFTTAAVADVGEARNVVVTIGTPVDEFTNPVIRVIRECCDMLLPYLNEEQLIILRSTVYPGTTEWVARYTHAKGKSLKIAFCPERVVQGKSIEELQTLPQIVSGVTSEAEQEAGELFKQIAPELVYLEPMEAEFAKLFNNAYRYIQFAVANQFYMITQQAGVDYYRVLEGVKKNYPRARDIPSAGFAAGPCLYKDTMQLAAFSGNNFSLGNDAVLINEGMVLYVVNELARSYDLETMRVGLLGMAFKANIDDTRASLSYKLKKTLQFRAAQVLTTDPHVTTDPELKPLDEVIAQSDVLILCTPHREYRNLNLQGKPLIDIWGYIGR